MTKQKPSQRKALRSAAAKKDSLRRKTPAHPSPAATKAIECDPDSEYLGMKLNRDANGRVILAFGTVLAKAGDTVCFLNKNGYEMERENAREAFCPGALLTVKRVLVGLSSSRYFFVEDGPAHKNGWNTVMFARIADEETPPPNEMGAEARSAEPVQSDPPNWLHRLWSKLVGR